MDPMILASAAVIVIGAVATAAVAIIKQLQAIHFLVNGTATSAAEKLTRLEARIEQLQAQRVQDAQIQTAQASQGQPPKAAPAVAAQVVEQTVEHQVVERQSIQKGKS